MLVPIYFNFAHAVFHHRYYVVLYFISYSAFNFGSAAFLVSKTSGNITNKIIQSYILQYLVEEKLA